MAAVRKARAAASKTTRRGGPRPGVDPGATRAAIFTAAAEAFSRRGFSAVAVDDIARAAGVNKAMIYYHFADKLALYREIFRDMASYATAEVTAILESKDSPDRKIARWIECFVQIGEERPYFPPMMMREIAEGIPHLDRATFAVVRGVINGFGRLLAEGQASGAFRPVHPILAYITLVAPLMFNAARERAASHAVDRAAFPMFVDVPHDQLTTHMQQVALRMLQKD